MPFQAVPNVAQVTINGRLDGQLTINDLYFEISGGGITPVNLLTLTTAVANWCDVNLRPNLSTSWEQSRFVGRDLGVQNGAVIDVLQSAAGGEAGECAPNNVAACISIKSGLAGRSFRGRNYLPGIPNSMVVQNTLDLDWMTPVTAAYNLLVGAGTFTPGWQFVVVSRQTASALRPTGVATPVVTCGFTTPYVRSMRSRSIGNGA